MALLLVAATGCAKSESSEGHACTLIGTPVGIGVDIAAPMAARTRAATLLACWHGSCTMRTLTLRPTTTEGHPSCTGTQPSDSCSVRSVRTGGKNGFADLPRLPLKLVRVTLTLTGNGGNVLMHRTLHITPRQTYPNGRTCPSGGAQANVTVDASGRLSQRH
ncbi:MAG: hypothetical protein ACRDRN_12055 [Sciscionella sp.]